MHARDLQQRFWGPAAFVGLAGFFFVFFLPAEFGKLMANGDAAFESIPALLGARHLWEPGILLGYPLYADPNQQLWYPLARLAASPQLYNAFAVAPFPIAAFGVWGFVRSITRSSICGIVAGFVFALGGFMISHAGHLMISHPAAWAPYVFWSIEVQRRDRSALALVGGSLAIGLCAVSGQPQVLAFTLALAATYAIVSGGSAIGGPRRFAVGILLMLAIGIGLGCVQLVPEARITTDSTRASIGLADYNVLEIPASQLAMRAVFPYALGVTRLAGYPYSGADLGTFTEDTIAVGVAALFLAVLSLASVGRDRRITYWFGIATLALVLAVGDATPLPTITHALPAYGLLRIPGRHAFEWSFAIAVLAGYGTASLRDGRASLRTIVSAIVAVIGIVGVAYFEFTSGSTSNADFVASALHVPIGSVISPQANGALGIPILTGSLGVLLICIAARFRSGPAFAPLLAIAIVGDTGTFAYAAYWNWAAISPNSIEPAPFVSRLTKRLEADGSRVAWLPGNLAGALAPNLTTLWNIPTIDGYSPLVPRRAVELLGLTPSGGVVIPTSRDVNFDIAGASVIALPAVPVAAVSVAAPFGSDAIHLFFSARHNDAVTHADLGLPEPYAATSIAYVSELGESTNVPQNADVASITVIFEDQTQEKHEILAGRDTSEFAFDRADIRPLMKHARATIYQSTGPGNTYLSSTAIAGYKPIERIAIDWHYPTAALTLEKISIVDKRTGGAHAFDTLAPMYADRRHWQPLAIDPSIVAFANARALPHAWFAEPRRADSAEALTSIRDGAFDPRHRVLVEEAIERVSRPAANDRVSLQSIDETEIVETVICARACFVVNRDAFDSDWSADVDGKATRTFVADLDLRGVVVPSGSHRLRFQFFPQSLAVGATTTFVAALLALALVIRSRALLASSRDRRRVLRATSGV